jgi:hypothetical protein
MLDGRQWKVFVATYLFWITHICIPCHLQISRQIDVGVHDQVINYYWN